MKKLFILFSLVIIGFVYFTGQKTDESPRWYFNPQMTSVQKNGAQLPAATDIGKIENPVKETRYVNMPDGSMMAINPNVRVYPSLNQQCEIYMTRDPNNPQILYVASQNITGGASINAGTYVSTNGGTTWYGSDSMAAGSTADQRGDPGPTIDKNGRFIYTHLTSTTNFGGLKGMGANYSTNKGLTWSNTFDVVIDANCDKNLANTDNVPSSPYYGNTYMAWTSFGTTPGNGRMSRTTDGGVTWSPQLVINATPTGHNAQGHDVVVGVNGEVYIFWTAGVSTSPFTEDFVGMAKSTNGGANFVATENAFDVNGSRSSSFNGWGIRTNGFPRCDIDKSTGPRRGSIYVVTSQINLAPAGTDADVILRKSTDGGATWSAGIRVNQDPLNNARVQYFPCVKVDEAGGINVVYYDNRDFPASGDSCTVYLSRSLDGGTTWTDTKIADHNFKPKNLPGVNTMGDYIGITTGNGKVYAAWMDDKTGSASTLFQTWVGSVTIQLNGLSPFNLQTPAASTRLVTFPGSTTPVTITWDTSTITANYKFIFGALPTRRLTIPAGQNSITTTLGALDDILAANGFTNTGAATDSLVGSWDVWAFKAPGAPGVDSLKSTNGPRAMTLRRGQVNVTPFALVSPLNNARIITAPNDNSNLTISWRSGGQGLKYKWQFDSPSFAGPVVFNIPSGNNQFDTTLTMVNSALDGMLNTLGIVRGDSIVGQWRVYAYRSPTDSTASSETRALTLRRVGALPLNESFISTTFPPVEWTYTGTGTQYWTRQAPGGYGATVGSAMFDYYSASGGTTQSLTTNQFPAVTAGANYLRFNYAHKFYQPTTTLSADSMAIYTSTDGGTTWARLITLIAKNTPATGYNSTNNLSTTGAIGNNTEYMTPANNEWGTKLLAMPIGTDRVRFTALSAFGNNAFIDDVTAGGPTGTGTPISLIPEKFELSQNYPNPFNPTTKINFAVPKQSFVSIKVFDVTGREVANLVNDMKAPGYHTVDFNASSFASGVYFYRIEAADFKDTKRMMLIK
ncbi:MAG: T9SS type A sorting domain-containing protein [Ignavibacteria bacterium]|nr:T9SS type A sorting domain-containing protein [Ignavibacteria bacterium]